MEHQPAHMRERERDTYALTVEEFTFRHTVIENHGMKPRCFGIVPGNLAERIIVDWLQ